MANICSNRFFFCCKHNCNKYMKMFEELKDQLSNLEFEVLDFDDNFCSIEGYFESKWTFPIEDFESILINATSEDPDECYFRCLSEEYGEGYVAMNIYSNGEWWDEQCFDL